MAKGKVGRQKKKGSKFPLTGSISRTPMLAKGATWNDITWNNAWLELSRKHLTPYINKD